MVAGSAVSQNYTLCLRQSKAYDVTRNVALTLLVCLYVYVVGVNQLSFDSRACPSTTHAGRARRHILIACMTRIRSPPMAVRHHPGPSSCCSHQGPLNRRTYTQMPNSRDTKRPEMTQHIALHHCTSFPDIEMCQGQLCMLVMIQERVHPCVCTL